MHPAWFIGAAVVGQMAPPPLPWWRLGVLAVIFLFLLGFWVLLNRKNWTQARLRGLLVPKEAQIVLCEQRWVNSKTSVCLIEVQGERFLLAQGHNGVAWQPLPSSSSPNS